MGVNITNGTASPSVGPLVDTGQLFLAGVSSTAGPQAAPVQCQSISDVVAAFGPRTTSTAVAAIYDYLDNFFREGGNNAYVIGYDTAGGYAAALDLLDPRLGAGQLAVVGEAPSADLYEGIQEAAASQNRVGLLDVNKTDNTAALLEANGAFCADLSDPSYVGLFGSWLNIPAPTGTSGVGSRQVPGSSTIAALCNRVDQAGNPNQPAGGRSFPLQYATSLVYDPTDVERATLVADDVNTFALKYGVLENYGFLTPIGQSSTTPFGQLNAARTRMYMYAQAQVIGENYYMKDIDGQGKLAAQLASDLSAMCNTLYTAGALYGDTAADAYSVNTGVTINTEADAASGTLNATVEARLSQYADTVNIELISVPVAGAVS